MSASLLLVALSMRDPNFSRTMIFITAHTAHEGAFGYLPNFVGGIVAKDKLTFASLHWNRQKSTLRHRTHPSVSDALEELSLDHEMHSLIGYFGWSKGQIEKEVEARSWIIAKKTELTIDSPTSIWTKVLEEMGSVYQITAHVPKDVEVN